MFIVDLWGGRILPHAVQSEGAERQMEQEPMRHTHGRDIAGGWGSLDWGGRKRRTSSPQAEEGEGWRATLDSVDETRAKRGTKFE